MGFAEGGHIGAEVVVPHFAGISFIFFAPGEEEDIGFHALGIEYTRGKSKDGVEIAFIHEVYPDFFAVAVGKEDVIGEYHRRPAAPF